jgi:hypothetical protein
MLLDVTCTRESLQVVFDRISISPGCSHSLSNSDPPAFTAQFEDLYRKFGQIAKNKALALYLFFKPRFLALKRI